MREIIWPILVPVGLFTVAMVTMGVIKSCDQPDTNFVFDKGDYRYVKLEEAQFNQLIKALENIASAKGDK